MFTEKRKDPGIPNSLPFKESVLREAEERKRKVLITRVSKQYSIRTEKMSTYYTVLKYKLILIHIFSKPMQFHLLCTDRRRKRKIKGKKEKGEGKAAE